MNPSKLSFISMPFRISIQKRFYDKKQYKKSLKLKEQKFTLEDSVELLRNYSFDNEIRFNVKLASKMNLGLVKLNGVQNKHKILVNNTDNFDTNFPNLEIEKFNDDSKFEDYDLIISSKKDFPRLVKIAKILGPMGKMPSFANGLVNDNLNGILEMLSQCSILKTDSLNILDMSLGRVDSLQNLKSVYQKLADLKPAKMESKPKF